MNNIKLNNTFVRGFKAPFLLLYKDFYFEWKKLI